MGEAGVTQAARYDTRGCARQGDVGDLAEDGRYGAVVAVDDRGWRRWPLRCTCEVVDLDRCTGGGVGIRDGPTVGLY